MDAINELYNIINNFDLQYFVKQNYQNAIVLQEATMALINRRPGVEFEAKRAIIALAKYSPDDWASQKISTIAQEIYAIVEKIIF